VLEQVCRLAEAEHAREACGLVVRQGSGWRVAALPNVAAGPDVYAMEPAVLLAAVRQVERGGGELIAFWHSHLDAPAELSRRDRDGAAEGGRPLWPGVEQLVVSLRGGRAAKVARYRFGRADFEEAPLED
jgi:[CysO sulfur-carrier protein]-S-L-cysteine hydrolase